MLAAKGLIESKRRVGTIVRDASNWNHLDLDVLDWMHDLGPDIAFVLGLIEARRAIEPAAAALAAERASTADLSEIAAGYLAMKRADLADLDACAAADVRFHVAILNASHNVVFSGLASIVGKALDNAFRLTTPVSRDYQATLIAHGEVLEAIRMRRPEEASARMRALIDIAIEDVRRI